MVEEFEAYAAEIRIYLQRAEVLKARVRSTEQLVCLPTNLVDRIANEGSYPIYLAMRRPER